MRKNLYVIASVLVLSLVLSNTALAVIDGGGTTGKIPKFTAPTTIGDSIITEKLGKIGIGTANPQEVLDVVGGSFFRGNSARSMFLAKQNGTGDVATFMQGGNYSLIIKNSGSVGIGTDSPDSGTRLTVVDADDLGGDILQVLSKNLTQGIGFTLADIHEIGSNGNNNLRINAQGPGHLILQNTSTGNVGIGTTNPERRLHVKSAAGGYTSVFEDTGSVGTILRLKNDNGRYWDIYHTGSGNGTGANKFGIVDASVNDYRLTIDSSGNVGIGTVNPTERLDVGGGNVKMGYQIVTNSQNNTTFLSAVCPSGQVVGGGCSLQVGGAAPTFRSSYPSSSVSWACIWNEVVSATTYAICANIR